VEELLSVAEADADTRSTMDSRIEIDADARIIQMMPQDELFGVESDEKSERKYFKVPKIVGNGVDLSKLQLRINYQNASKIPSGKDMYIVQDATVYNDEWVYFSWELSRKVTQYKGNIYFIVCAVKADSKGNITNEWNTTLAEGKVLEGLEVETSQEQQYQASDYLEQLKQQLLEYSKEIKDTFPSDYTETVENVKNLQSDVKKLDANKITKFYTNNNGDTVLNDSDDGKIQDLIIYGKSEQKQYTGKNLLNYEKWKTVNIENGTAVYENNGVTITAESEDAYTDYTSENAKILVTVGKTYILSWESEQIEGSRAFIFPNGMIANSVEVKNEKQVKYTVPVGIDYITFRVGVLKKGQTISFKNIMFEEGSERTDFEPYTGGKPSPSPEYPQEIKAVVNPVIKTHGTNLLDIKDVAETVDKNNGLTYSVQKGIIKVKGTATSSASTGINFMSGVNKKITANNTYIFNPNPTKKEETSVCYLDFSNNVNLGMSISGNSVNKPINIQEIQASYMFTLFVRVTKGAKIDMEWKPQLLLSNTLLPYQPYQSSQATLPYELYAIPVSSGGNVTIGGQRYMADYVDIEKGVLVRNVKKMNIDSYTWKLNEETVGTVRTSKSIFLNSTTRSERILSNKFTNLYSSEGFDRSWSNKIYNITNGQLVMLLTYGIEVTEEQWNKIKDGLVILYKLSEPEKVDLIQDQIEAFKELSTYYPKTYINAESEQLNAYTMFNYPVSMEKGWEYVKQQIGDTRKYVYDMDTKLTETEASTLEAKIDTAILSEMIGG
jgi:hypothetical protein